MICYFFLFFFNTVNYFLSSLAALLALFFIFEIGNMELWKDIWGWIVWVDILK
jgi:hypothetical protein